MTSRVNSASPRHQAPSQIHLALRWFARDCVNWLKEPAAVALNICYPLIMMIFLFVIGGADLRHNAEISSASVAMLGLMGVLLVGVNLPANGINEIRGSNYYYYIRTLPLGIGARLCAWVGSPFILGIISGIITLIVGSLVSAAHYSPMTIIKLLLTYAVFGLCTTLIGTFFGFILTKRTSLAIGLGLAFIFLLLSGGRIMTTLPTPLQVLSNLIPSSAGVEICKALFEGGHISPAWYLNFFIWILLGAIGSLWAIRHDEKRKFA